MPFAPREERQLTFTTKVMYNQVKRTDVEFMDYLLSYSSRASTRSSQLALLPVFPHRQVGPAPRSAWEPTFTMT